MTAAHMPHTIYDIDQEMCMAIRILLASGTTGVYQTSFKR